jgi:hypothetical protein
MKNREREKRKEDLLDPIIKSEGMTKGRQSGHQKETGNILTRKDFFFGRTCSFPLVQKNTHASVI